MVLLDLAFILVGVLALAAGAEGVVQGGSKLARGLKVTSLFIGLTLAAFGTSLPEFMVSAIASYRGQAGIALGNVIGSNIFNILAVLGPAAVILPLTVNKTILRQEIPTLLVATMLFVAFSLDGSIARWEGGVLVACIVAYTVVRYGMSRRRMRSRAKKLPRRSVLPEPLSVRSVWGNVALVVFGLVGLLLGAHLVVESAASIAVRLGVEDRVIAITLVAMGTSLPEFVVTVFSAWRDKVDIGVGNVVGSCIFNLLFVLGGAALARPVGVPEVSLRFEVPVMVGAFLLLALMLWGDDRVSRWQGLVLVGGMVLFLVAILAGWGGLAWG